jgi:hypothetical protein
MSNWFGPQGDISSDIFSYAQEELHDTRPAWVREIDEFNDWYDSKAHQRVAEEERTKIIQGYVRFDKLSIGEYFQIQNERAKKISDRACLFLDSGKTDYISDSILVLPKLQETDQ